LDIVGCTNLSAILPVLVILGRRAVQLQLTKYLMVGKKEINKNQFKNQF
jgi:hypothetical protein